VRWLCVCLFISCVCMPFNIEPRCGVGRSSKTHTQRGRSIHSPRAVQFKDLIVRWHHTLEARISVCSVYVCIYTWWTTTGIIYFSLLVDERKNFTSPFYFASMKTHLSVEPGRSLVTKSAVFSQLLINKLMLDLGLLCLVAIVLNSWDVCLALNIY
jgi:hypothetical protein